MSKLIMWNIITLDGYFDTDKSWELPFHQLIWGAELEKLSIEQLQSAAALVFGRKTYEGMAAYWQQADGAIAELMNRIPKFVFSRTLDSVTWNNSMLIKGDALAEMEYLKKDHNADLFVFGSADLSETFISHDLFDEYRIGVAPVLLGKGRRLFHATNERRLQLISVKQLETGGLIAIYTRDSQQ